MKKTLTIILLIPLLAGCSLLNPKIIPNPSKTVHVESDARPPVCSVWPVIRYSGKRDTPETVDEIILSNEARKTYCQ